MTILTVLALAAPAVAKEKPKLILQITVDQFRGDLPTRYYDRLGQGGLRYLLDQGVVYNNAYPPLTEGFYKMPKVDKVEN